jgi:spermidine synthase
VTVHLPVVQKVTENSPLDARAALQPLIIVFCVGFNLILVQWMLVRELTTLLLGTELVTLLVSVSYFFGLSLGYSLAGRVKRRWLHRLAVLTLLLHLALPIWFRMLVAVLTEASLYRVSFILLPLLVPFAVTTFYAIFLPAFADSQQASLRSLYGTELLGSGLGVLSLLALGSAGIVPVLVAYGIALLVILRCLGVGARTIFACAVAGAAWLLIFPSLNAWSNARWYSAVHSLPTDTITLYTGYSAYQKVDVLEVSDGRRLLYLDGLQHYGDDEGGRLNVILGWIPASLVRPQQALVIGAGSMEMERWISEYAGHVRTVEIDPMVVDVSLRYFDHVNWMSRLSNRSVVIDDAKHYLANADERYELVSTDTPAAYSLQTATLYSVPFYEAVAARLNRQGVLAANLTSTFVPSNPVSRRVAASLLAVFDQVMVVTPASADWSFAYASDSLPFDRNQLATALRESGEMEFLIYDTPAVRAIVGDARPITLDTLDIALYVSGERIAQRLQR